MRHFRASLLVSLPILLLGCSTTDKAERKARYASDSDPIYYYLESLQKQAHQRDNSAPAWKPSGAAFLTNRARLSEQTATELGAVLREPLPTRYENPLSYGILSHCAEKVAEAAKTMTRSREFLPHYGTLPFFGVNGEMIPVNDGDLIVFNQDLFLVLSGMSKVALLTTKIETDAEGAEKIDFSEEYAREVLQSGELQTQLGHLVLFCLGFETLKKGNLPREYVPAVQKATEAMHTFVVGHEFGHVLLKHEPQGKGRLLALPALEREMPEKLLHSWLQELEADILGFTLAAAVVENEVREAGNNPRAEAFRVYASYNKAAALLFFVCAEILEEAAFIYRHRAVPPDVHVDVLSALDEIDQLIESSSAGRPFKRELRTIQRSVQISAGDHPPASLRRIVVMRALQREVRSALSPEESQSLNHALALGRNLRAVWLSTRSRLIPIVAALDERQRQFQSESEVRSK